MSVDDKVSLFSSAARVTQRTADAATIEAALDEVHAHIFGEGAVLEAGASTLLHRISDARAIVDNSEAAERCDLDTVRLLLEAVLTLSETLVSAAAGRKIRSRTVKRLEDVVLPILFLRSNVTAQQLRAHILKAPLALYESACRTPHKEVEKVEAVFASWKANHGWDFSTQKERRRVPIAATASVPSAASEGNEKKDSARDGGPSGHQRAVLRDISWNTALKRSAGAGIPSYLLSKRRPVDGSATLACSVPLLGASCTHTTPSHTPHTNIDNSGVKSGAKVLALESPVKRRRIDFNMGVPPSPDRPGRCL